MRDSNNEEGRCFPIPMQSIQSPQTTVLKLKTKGIHLLGTCFLLPLQFVIWHAPYSSYFYTNFQCFPFWPFDLYNEYLGFIYIFFVWPCGIFFKFFFKFKVHPISILKPSLQSEELEKWLNLFIYFPLLKVDL